MAFFRSLGAADSLVFACEPRTTLLTAKVAKDAKKTVNRKINSFEIQEGAERTRHCVRIDKFCSSHFEFLCELRGLCG
jgi:hypothetical protein